MAKWTRPADYSKSVINKAGRALTEQVWTVEREESLRIVNNWRSSHGYPLHIATKTLKKRAKQVDRNVFVGQRLKTLRSTTAKLSRFPEMQLARMHDIAGCRAVMSNVEKVNLLVNHICESYELGSFRLYDYIAEPKLDGYRSAHIVGRYKSKKEENSVYDGMQIELQVRSQLQHAWAMAVETVSLFTGQQLKSNIGDEHWKKFFALMSSAIATMENCPTVPHTPQDKSVLVEEIRRLINDLGVLETLKGWRVVVTEMEIVAKNAKTFLLELHTAQKMVRIYQYTSEEAAYSRHFFSTLETQYADDKSVHVALVTVDSINSLRKAYPSFSADTTEFVKTVERVIEGDL